jgi:hypothetical protein
MLQRFRHGPVVSSHQEVRKSNTRTALSKAAAGVFAQAEVGCRPVVERLESREMLSATYYVSTSGSNSNAGTVSAPFKTIQWAANVAGSGDHVDIETGTYHETVTPHSGTIFQNYNGEKVTISGADPIGGWSDYKGSIYSAPMPSTLGAGNDQVFVNGVSMNWAEYPNTPIGDYSKPYTATMGAVTVSGGTAVIHDAALSQGKNYWVGAYIHMDDGQAWEDQTGNIVASSPGSITVHFVNHAKYHLPTAGNKFQIEGAFNALDTAGEWYRDPGTGKLYLWAPNGGSPAGSDVEIKTREFGFNLSGAKNVTIQGINLFACSIETSNSSSGVTINGITAAYVSQSMLIPTGWYLPNTDGIEIKGSGDVLENSTIEYSTGDGVIVGPNSRVVNNIIHDVDNTGANVAAVRMLAGGSTVSHNTIYNSGRHGILAEVTHATVSYNYIYAVGLQTTEPGAIYTANINGQGSIMAYNIVTDIHTGGWGGTGLFLDNNTSGWIVHNNIVTNVDYALKFNFSAHNNDIYNNTLEGTLGSVGGSEAASWSGTIFKNNIFIGAIRPAPGATWISNVTKVVGGMGAGSFSAGATGATGV